MRDPLCAVKAVRSSKDKGNHPYKSRTDRKQGTLFAAARPPAMRRFLVVFFLLAGCFALVLMAPMIGILVGAVDPIV